MAGGRVRERAGHSQKKLKQNCKCTLRNTKMYIICLVILVINILNHLKA